MSHLINDNHAVVYGTSNHLGGLDSSSGRHLVVVKQRTNWNNKEMVVTPTEQKYFTAWSLGKERYPANQGGTLVYNDTNVLLDNVKSKMNSSQQWKDGNCALFSVFSRAEGPYAKYDEIINNGEPANTISEFGTSVVAYKFNMRHLHFSKMTSFKTYARCWAPSLVASEPTLLAGDGILISGSLYNNASKLRIKFFSELPSLTYNLATSGDSLEFGDHSNNGRVVTTDTLVEDVMVIYEPFNVRDRIEYNDGNSTRIYTLQKNW